MRRRGGLQIDVQKFLEARQRLGMTLADVGAKIGISTGAVHAWEKGTARPHPKYFPIIKKVMGDVLVIETVNQDLP